MKRLFLIMLAVCGFALSANAQYYNKILLFIEMGKTIDDVYSIIYLHFDDDGKMWKTSLSKSDARDKYAKGILEEYGVNYTHTAKRDYSVDTSKYSVYSETHYTQRYGPTERWFCGQMYTEWGYYNVNDGKDYYGIEYGGSSLVTWYVPKDSSEVRKKTYYKAIQPSDLAIKAPDTSFLNY